MPEYTLNRNGLVGSPGYGYFASEQQLDEMGRLCGLYTTLNEFTHGPSEHWVMDVHLDFYSTTPGAKEAFQRWAKALGGSSDVGSADLTSLEAVGDERNLRRARAVPEFQEWDSYNLLFRRRNIVVLLGLDYGGPTHKGRPELVVEYAAQLDRNIEAAAQQQSE